MKGPFLNGVLVLSAVQSRRSEYLLTPRPFIRRKVGKTIVREEDKDLSVVYSAGLSVPCGVHADSAVFAHFQDIF